MSSEAKRFDSVSTPEEWGVADATGLHLYESHRDAPSGFPFGVCRIDGRQLAVFIETEASVEARAELASRKARLVMILRRTPENRASFAGRRATS